MIGKTISHYRILEKLGEGGMGVVYKAYDSKLEREVAIKFLPYHLASTEEASKRFLNEAKSASALNHPNVCIIYSFDDFFNSETGRTEFFIVMEFINGTTLREKNKDGPLRISDAVFYSIQIAEALKEAHANGIAHLDIKSDNIMINSKEQIKVMDFGLAKLRDSKDESLTEETYGTVAYMSPEQTMGKTAGCISDIWSLGVVMYEMLTGKLPFMHGYDAAIIYSIVNETVVPPSRIREDIHSDLEKVILGCLEKEEDKRYQNTEVILRELKRIKEEFDKAVIKKTFEKDQYKDEKKGTEQKQATIVLMKIKEYAELVEKIGHERVVEILESYYKKIYTITQKYGGMVKKIERGDILLYFGLPATIENSSQNALLAAIEISDSISGPNEEVNLPINLTVNTGINTGMVIAGNISSGSGMEYTVIGDTVEIALKISEISSSGQILVGESTQRNSRNIFEFEQQQSITLKGKRDPVKVYKLRNMKEKTGKSKDNTGRLIHSEMIGRISELDKLEYLLHKTINGEGTIVNIIADAGIGKSRLISEFKKKEVVQRVNVFEGKALSIGKNISFHPIIDILRKWALINDNDNESQAFSKLENSLQRIFGEEADEVIPFIATLMGFSLSDKYEKRFREVSGDLLNKLIQKNIRDLILKGSQIKPIVFIIEDLHWTDLSSLDLLLSLLRLAENNKLLFINTLRPNFQETGDRFISIIREKYSSFYSEIKLKPLNNLDCEIFLQNLLKTDNLPIHLKNSISKSTDGNPFFIEEVIRSLIDDKVIEIRNGSFDISQTIDQIVIPGTIKDVLLSRIDKLDESTKNLLKNASVIGRHFLIDVLIKVSQEIDNIDSRIRYLEKIELIEENKNNSEREYLFKHALVQEAVYETLLSRNKQELHKKVALAIEDLYPERIHDFYEMLAQHYNQADDQEKAGEYLLKAGERTIKSAASYEALNYFREALKLYMHKYGENADKEKIFMMEKNIGLSFYNRGYIKEAVEHFTNALKAAGMKTTRSNFSEILRLISNFVLILKRLYITPDKNKPPSEKDYIVFDILFKIVIAYANSNGKKMFFELLNLVRMKLDYKLSGEDGFITYSIAGSLFCFSGISFSLGQKFINRANQYARLYRIEEIYQNGYDETLCDCLSGNWKNFTGINEKLLDTKIRAGELTYVVYQICWALYIIISRGEYDYAEYLINKGDEISEIYDFDYGKLYTLSLRADFNLSRRNLHAAIKYYDESIELANKLGLNTWIIGLAGKKAKAQILLNELTAAKNSIYIAEKAMEKDELLPPLLISYLEVYKLLYLIRLYEGEVKGSSYPEQKIQKLEWEIRKSIKIALKISNKVAEVKPEVDRFIGIYYCTKGRDKKAYKCFQRSIAFAKHLGALPELGRTYLEMGKLLLQIPVNLKNEKAESYFIEAYQIFEKLNLKWDLDELNRLNNFST